MHATGLLLVVLTVLASLLDPSLSDAAGKCCLLLLLCH